MRSEYLVLCSLNVRSSRIEPHRRRMADLISGVALGRYVDVMSIRHVVHWGSYIVSEYGFFMLGPCPVDNYIILSFFW